MAKRGITKLQSVNRMLKAIGTPPTSSLDTGGSTDVAWAESTLDDMDRQIQQRGWHFNLEENHELAKDADGLIPLEADSPVVRSRYTRTVTTRGDNLYDTRTRSKVFTSNVDVDQVVKLDFEDCPPTFKEYVVASAIVRFQREAQGNNKIDQFLLQDMYQAKGTWEAEDNRQGNYSLFDSRSYYEIMGERNTIGFGRAGAYDYL